MTRDGPEVIVIAERRAVVGMIDVRRVQRICRDLPPRLLRLAAKRVGVMHRPHAEEARGLGLVELVELVDDDGAATEVRVAGTDLGHVVGRRMAYSSAETEKE